MSTRSPRVSLTSKQLETAIGIDLLALCQGITSDGSVTTEEAEELRRWLEENASIELPAIGYLRTVVEQILADGCITKEELKELHQAIEKVLPPDHRKTSQAVRKNLEQIDKAKMRPVARLDSMVAGVTHEGRAYVVHKHVEEGDRVFLVRDRANRYSKAAIEVRLENGMQIGYVPDDEAQHLAPVLDAGAVHTAWIKKIWPGKRVDVPIIAGAFYAADSDFPGCVSQKACPAPTPIPASYVQSAETVMRTPEGETRTSASPSSRGCAVLIVSALLAFVIVLSR
jgi:hypothetical protein